MTRKFLALCSSIVGISALVLFASVPAMAASIPNAITSITLSSDSTVANGSSISLGCDWAVPDGSAAGDTFTLQLPSQLTWTGSTTFNLTDSDNDVVATATVDGSGLVTFTLSSFVTTHPNNVHGTCSFTTVIDTTGLTPGANDLNFTVGSTVLRVPVTVSAPCPSCSTPGPNSAVKGSYWSNNDQTVIHSYIEGPATTDASNTVVMTDTPDPGSVIDCSTVDFAIGRWNAQTAYIVEPDDSGIYPADIKCTPATLTVTWTHIPAGLYTRVDLDTDVTNGSLGQYTNTGTVAMNGNATPVSAAVETTSAAGTGQGAAPTPTPTASPVSTPSPTPIRTASPAPKATSTSQPTAAGTLAFTGSNPAIPFLVGIAFTGVGLATFLTGRRRRVHK